MAAAGVWIFVALFLVLPFVTALLGVLVWGGNLAGLAALLAAFTWLGIGLVLGGVLLYDAA